MVSEQYFFSMDNFDPSSSTPIVNPTTSTVNPAASTANPPTSTANTSTNPPIAPYFAIQHSSSPSDPIISLNMPLSIKLNQTNFLTWKSHILSLIHGHNLTKFLTSSSPNPTIQSQTGQVELNPDFLPWNRQDQLLLGWLRSSLSESISAQVLSCTTTSSLWLTLQQLYASTSRAKLIDLKRQLQTATKKSTSCTEFLQLIRRLADELAFIGAPVSDDDLVLTVLNGLGPDYNSFVAAVTATSRHEILSFADLQGMLLSHEGLLKSQAVTASTQPSAFVTFSQSGAPRPPNQHQRQRPSKFRPPVQLNYQFRNSTNTGHQQSRPPNQSTVPQSITQQQPNSNTSVTQPDSTTQRPPCQICKKPNHSAKNCKYRYTPDPSYQPRSNF